MYKIEELKPIIKEVIESSNSMMEAASKTKLNFKTFIKYAKVLELYNPNQSGRGIYKKKPTIIKTEDILKGLYPQFQTFKLLKRLIKEGIKEKKCEQCSITTWNDREAPLELDHIDGNPYNHILSNLRVLCPNCHAQTSTHRGKNCTLYKTRTCTDIAAHRGLSPACLPIPPIE